MLISINPKRIKEPEVVARGLQLHKAGHLDEARALYHQVLDKYPEHAVAKFLLALLYEAANEPDHAFMLMDEVVRTKPNFFEAWYNRGVVLHWLGRIAEARASYERALKLEPRFASAWTNLGNARMALGDHEGAIAAYDRATELVPDTSEGTHNRSFVYLLRGQWDQGWRDYETRWGLPGATCPIPAGATWWQDEPLAGKHLALVHEQGFGDTFMMLRYVPGLLAMGARVTLCVPQELGPICRASFPAVELRTDGSWPDCDYALPFMSLPSRFGTTPDTVPSRDRPYLKIPGERSVVEGQGFPVAFAWRGSSSHKNNRNRSTRLADWLPVLMVPGISWYCLQRDITDSERRELAKIPGMHLVTTADWTDTGRVLRDIDRKGGAVVSVDTGLVHLAGAMGLTTAVLISALPDFRWMHHRKDTAWYESMAVYRQPFIGDWHSPITELAARLRAITQEAEAA